MENVLLLLLLVAGHQQIQSVDASYKIATGNQTELVLNIAKNIHQLNEEEKREIYHYEQIFVIRDSGLEDNIVRRCELIEVYDEGAAENVTETLSISLNKTVEKVDMEIMMLLFHDCDTVRNLDDLKTPTNTNYTDVLRYSTAGLIFPGTKWCGRGDEASSYHDLGEERMIDKCCRAHDFCPIKVLGNDNRYNLTNPDSITTSHCLCDTAFDKCLARAGSFAASLVKILYFAFPPECITGVPELPKEKMKFERSTVQVFIK